MTALFFFQECYVFILFIYALEIATSKINGVLIALIKNFLEKA